MIRRLDRLLLLIIAVLQPRDFVEHNEFAWPAVLRHRQAEAGKLAAPRRQSAILDEFESCDPTGRFSLDNDLELQREWREPLPLEIRWLKRRRPPTGTVYSAAPTIAVASTGPCSSCATMVILAPGAKPRGIGCTHRVLDPEST